ncbi:3-methyl-2-oxobutanoate hydroxymethyltransferase [Polynucleobacter sp. 30F-ANTBAC]|jgi:3-methyl-2-oxobutanoate hydroxymethyltransferase|uniref:3-methyl-2-oxobutanoate hydroxymethyltransferase n=1 Tax=Polynucleobacter sp. 30F-ANTBAC TaxID=2689095 RepID=UPI001C0C6B7D|nr:3-methyl-2-oxobutanoate hydroxymethyltransferase [Polynucleobacter sp. 30F-ANTBAC]MBU3600321.1 3-methyl-2-oxobutanoate hydroxymethyltransferase [Polynucleobacter sp. 30F-ANTBAC]
MAYLQEKNAARSAKSITQLHTMHQSGEKIAMLTAYESSFAALLDHAGIDAILVGDSLGNVIQGHSTTTPVTIADMAYHTQCVSRGNQAAFVIADMPFGSYSTPEQAMDNAATLMRAGAQMVKLEGGEWLAETVKFLVQRSVPVCGHLGLLPQSIHTLGGFKVQGKSPEAAQQLVADAIALESAGAQMIVLEAIPSELGSRVTQSINIPTIGIGAGPDCSGQVLVMHDMLGAFPGRSPKFVKNFLEGQPSIEAAVKAYVEAVKAGTFPSPEHCFKA